MWVSKEAEVRKKEILDAALDLFYSKGYDKTSINDIINRVGVTKGSFYYHFKTKDEILDKIALQQAEEMVQAFIVSAEGNDGNTLEKINSIIAAMQEYRNDTAEKRLKIFEVLDKSENTRLKQKVYENYMRLSKPIVSKIIGQGVAEGVFRTTFPDELAEFYIHLSLSINGTLNKLILELGENPENIEMIRRKLEFYEELLAKILGVKKGSILFADPVLRIRIRKNNGE